MPLPLRNQPWEALELKHSRISGSFLHETKSPNYQCSNYICQLFTRKASAFYATPEHLALALKHSNVPSRMNSPGWRRKRRHCYENNPFWWKLSSLDCLGPKKPWELMSFRFLSLSKLLRLMSEWLLNEIILTSKKTANSCQLIFCYCEVFFLLKHSLAGVLTHLASWSDG